MTGAGTDDSEWGPTSSERFGVDVRVQKSSGIELGQKAIDDPPSFRLLRSCR